MIAVVNETVRKEIENLDRQSPLAKRLSAIGDVDKTISEEIERICGVATWAEITKALFMVKRLNKASAEERKVITSELDGIAGNLIRRAQIQSGPLKLSEVYQHLFSEF